MPKGIGYGKKRKKKGKKGSKMSKKVPGCYGF